MFKQYCLSLFYILTLIILTSGKILPSRYDNEKFVKWDKVDNSFSKTLSNKSNKVPPGPPDHKEYVAMARYIMHQADWTSIATISQISNIQSYPFTSVVSMSDGTVEKSVGIPYFYLTPLDYPSIDLKQDSRCTISASLVQTDFCRSNDYVPDDPRCARVMLSGRIEKMQNGTAEYDFAKLALFSRHHSMANLPKNHGFYVAKMNIENIVMLDWFGGPAHIPVEKYLAYNGTYIL